MTEAARALNRGYFMRVEQARPWVRLKLATSIDGATAMAGGESRWITGEAARRDVQRLRAASACVLTGIGTVLADDPQLNVRLSATELGIEGEVRQPLRAVLDSRLRIAAQARVLQPPSEALVITADEGPHAPLAETGVSVRRVGRADPGLDLAEALRLLADEFLVNEVHVEAGATLAGALLSASLVDELVCYVAPHLMGSSTRPMASLPLEHMSQRLAMTLVDCRRVGEDLRLTWQPAPAST